MKNSSTLIIQKREKNTFSSCLPSWQFIGLYYLCSNIYFQNQIQNLRFQPFKIALFSPDSGHTQYYYISTIILPEEAETGLVEAVESEREKRQKQEEGAWEKDERALFSIYCFFFFLFFFEASWYSALLRKTFRVLRPLATLYEDFTSYFLVVNWGLTGPVTFCPP